LHEDVYCTDDIAIDLVVARTTGVEGNGGRLPWKNRDSCVVITSYSESVRLYSVFVDEVDCNLLSRLGTEYRPVLARGAVADAVIVPRLCGNHREGCGIGLAIDATHR